MTAGSALRAAKGSRSAARHRRSRSRSVLTSQGRLIVTRRTGERRLAHVEHRSREVELAGDRVDDVDLTRVEAGCERVGGDLELEERRLPIRRIERRAFDDGRL